MLVVKDIYKEFKDKKVLKGVSFNVNKKDNIALLGNNGAGKSTLIKIISGQMDSKSGQIETKLNFNSEVGIMPQDDILIDDLTVKEIISLKLSMCGLKNEDYLFWLKEVNLENCSNIFVGKLSGGQKRRLSLVLSMVNEPKIVFLDEPTTGMDLDAVDKFWELMRTKDFALVIITHDFNQIDTFFNRVLILNDGVIVSDTTVDKLHSFGQTIEEHYRKVMEKR
ncbi:ABC transporter ATP-binding protein [Companilactobacillus versmoldensis]|uniref:ABC transporter n=1 Tax=Companilactobacillus versmoldensis DSM 14857 = KCTC 3814 TaxID=1423815 RepID=A0A0R1SDJ3_9LACO|nr:ABC transporter ATP-binding protein [Companilactobacillus versmoldensis]KRL67184.1 ABC transporter [Companilactobacillus versmoldensis DSM 14857 = KCTC 3814]